MKKLIIKKDGEYIGCIRPDKLDAESVLSITAQAIQSGCTIERFDDHVPTLEGTLDWPKFEVWE